MRDRTLRYVAIFMVGFVVALGLSASILYITYRNAASLASSCSGTGCYVSDEVYYVNVARKIMQNIFQIDGNNWWPSSDKIQKDYYNLEHPPLAKYFIGLSMLLFGDKPVSWRIPSIIFTSSLPVIVYFIVTKKFEGSLGVLAGILGGIALLFDPVVHVMGSLAMLDPYLAFFTALSVLLLVYDKEKTASLSLGLALSVKYSGFFLAPMFYIYYRIKGKGILRSFLLSAIIPVAVLIIVNIPMIAYFGVNTWLEKSVIGAVEWHTTSRGPGPPASTPWGWIMNHNYFVMSYVPHKYPAIVNSVVYAVALLGSIILLPMFLPRGKFVGVGALLSVWLGYVLTYIAGNHTLYSFYTIQLSPLAALAFSEVFIATYLVSSIDFKKEYRNQLDMYVRFLKLEKRFLPEEIKILPWFKETLSGYSVLYTMLSIVTGLYFLDKNPFFDDYIGLGYIINHGYPDDRIRIGVYNMLFAAILIPLILQYFYHKQSYPKSVRPEFFILISGIMLSSFNPNSLLLPMMLLGLLYMYRNNVFGAFVLGLTAYSIPVMIGFSTASLIFLGPGSFVAFIAGIMVSIGLSVSYMGMTSILEPVKIVGKTLSSYSIYNVIGAPSYAEQYIVLLVTALTYVVITRVLRNRNCGSVNIRSINIDGFVILSSTLTILLYLETSLYSPDRIAPLLVLLGIYGCSRNNVVNKYISLSAILMVLSVFSVNWSISISKIIFKYEPSSLMDPFAFHNILGYFSEIIIVLGLLVVLSERKCK